MKWSEAVWKPVPNYSGTLDPIAVCLHHQAGNGGLQELFSGPQETSAHFWIAKDGRVEQYVDTANRAWHGVAHNDYSIGVETEGCAGADEPLTEAQLDRFAELMRWARDVHGIPLELSESVYEPGLNYHRCEGGPATACPCQVRVNQRAEILRRAGGAPSSPSKPPSTIAPELHVDYFGTQHNRTHGDVRTWQARMHERGWSLAVDQIYGAESEGVCRDFQREKGLAVDGLVGPETWGAAWSAPIT